MFKLWFLLICPRRGRLYKHMNPNAVKKGEERKKLFQILVEIA